MRFIENMDLHFEEYNEQSIKRFEKMLKTEKVLFFDSEEFERIIEYYIDSGKIVLAKKAISLALDQHPDTNAVLLLYAEIMIQESNELEALQALDRVALLEPSNIDVFLLKSSLCSKKGKHEEAINLLNQATAASDETNIDILSRIGMEYLYLEEFEKALLFFRNCIEIKPDDYNVLHNIIYCFDMLEKHDESIIFLKEHIETHPFDETAWHQLGRQYSKKENHIEALKAYDYAIVIDDSFIGAYMEKAKTLEKLEQYDAAIGNYILTTKLGDATAFAYVRIAYCFEKTNNLLKAKEYYSLAYQQDPSFEKPIIALVNLYYNAADYQNTLFYVNKLINIDDENPNYWRIYAQSNLKISFYEEAAKAFNICLNLNEKTLEVFIGLANTYYYIGDFKAAIKTLLKAEIYYHNHAEIEYRLSGFYFLIKSSKLGEMHLLNALSIKPNIFSQYQKLFPILHNSKLVKSIIKKHKRRFPNL